MCTHAWRSCILGALGTERELGSGWCLTAPPSRSEKRGCLWDSQPRSQPGPSTGPTAPLPSARSVDRQKGPNGAGRLGLTTPSPAAWGAPRVGMVVLGPKTFPAQDSCPPEPGFLRVGSPPFPPQEARKPETLTQPSGTRVGLWPSGGQLPSGVCGEGTSAWDGAPSGHREPSRASRTGLLLWPRGVSSQGT